MEAFSVLYAEPQVAPPQSGDIGKVKQHHSLLFRHQELENSVGRSPLLYLRIVVTMNKGEAIEECTVKPEGPEAPVEGCHPSFAGH